MKIRPVGAELFHAGWRTDRRVDRQTDMTKPIAEFLNFASAPQNVGLTLFKQHTNKCTYIVFNNLKFSLKHLKRSYMFRSYDHPQGAYFVPC